MCVGAAHPTGKGQKTFTFMHSEPRELRRVDVGPTVVLERAPYSAPRPCHEIPGFCPSEPACGVASTKPPIHAPLGDRVLVVATAVGTNGQAPAVAANPMQPPDAPRASGGLPRTSTRPAPRGPSVDQTLISRLKRSIIVWRRGLSLAQSTRLNFSMSATLLPYCCRPLDMVALPLVGTTKNGASAIFV